jgi:integrase/recombinase XerD
MGEIRETKRKGRATKGTRAKSNRDMNNISKLFDEFYAIKKAEGRAPRTLDQYKENFGYFMNFLTNHDLSQSIDDITRETIRNYIIFMRDKKVKYDDHHFKRDEHKTVGLSPQTINTRLKTLRVMFKLMQEEGRITENPMLKVKNLDEPDDGIDVLKAAELRRLFAVPNQRHYADFRDYVLMNLLLDGMMRISEALSLKIDDYDFADNTVTIPAAIAKNRKTRTLPLQKRTVKLIKELIVDNKMDFDSEYVFLTNYGEPLTRDHFRNRLQEFAKRAGITKRVHPHLLRHTSATMFLESGGDIGHLRMLLGHSDLRMVLRYTHLSGESLRRQHDQYTAMNKVLEKLNKPRKTKR